MTIFFFNKKILIHLDDFRSNSICLSSSKSSFTNRNFNSSISTTTTTTKMADDVLEFSGLRVNFDDKSGCNGKVNGLDDGNRRFYIGQLISLQINLPLTEAGLKKLITSHSEKSPVAQNLFLAFMRQLSTTVDLKYSFKPFVNESSRTLAPDSHQWMECLLISTLHDAQCCPEKAVR